jgi:hypothetical protein
MVRLRLATWRCRSEQRATTAMAGAVRRAGSARVLALSSEGVAQSMGRSMALIPTGDGPIGEHLLRGEVVLALHAALAEQCEGEARELGKALGRLSQQQDRCYRAIEEGKLELEVVSRPLHEPKSGKDGLPYAKAIFSRPGGEAGIRTLDRAFGPVTA